MKIDVKKIFKSKLFIVILVSVVLLTGVGLAVGLTWQLPLLYDKSTVTAVENNVVLYDGDEYGGYYSLGKVDADGKLTDEEFKIMNFTDMHLCGKKTDEMTMDNFIAAVVSEKPDLITLTGDIITSGYNKKRATQFAEVMESLNIYWAPVLGNHEGDQAASISRSEFLELWSGYSRCLMRADVKDVEGNGNYVINLLNSQGKVRESLYFIDSGSKLSASEAEAVGVEEDDYAFIKENQINWYKETVSAVEKYNGTAVKSVMFIHIPLVEYKEAYEEATVNGLTYGVAGDNDSTLIYGEKREKVCSSTYNSGMFAVIMELNSTEAVISGHDHVNDYCVVYRGVKLAYGQGSGYSTYNMVSKGLGDYINGYTELTVSAEGGADITHVIY